MFDLNKFKTDEKRELEGVWQPMGGDGQVLLAKAGNDRFVRGWNRIPASIRKQIDMGRLEEAETAGYLCRLLAKTILLNWEGMGDNGKKVEYSEENAVKMLMKYKGFRNFIWDIASEEQTFQAEAEEEQEKNLKSV